MLSCFLHKFSCYAPRRSPRPNQSEEREAKLVQTQEELAQTKAHVEILTMKNHELKQSQEQVEVLTKKNQELSRSNANLEALTNIVLVLLAVAAFVYVGMALTSEAA